MEQNKKTYEELVEENTSLSTEVTDLKEEVVELKRQLSVLKKPLSAPRVKRQKRLKAIPTK